MKRITEYTFGPETERDPVRVIYRGADLWAVVRGHQCLSNKGVWDFEPLPSSRTETWLATHRFSKNVALKLAQAEVKG